MAFGGFLKQSTAVDVLIGPFVDSTDGYTAETGLTIDVEVSKNGQALANKNDATAPVHDGAGDVDGYYNCELDTTDTNTVGQLVLVCYAAGALPCRHEFQVVEEAIYDSLFAASAAGFDANQRVNVGQWLSQAVTLSTGNKPDVNIDEVSDDATAAATLELFVEALDQVDGQIDAGTLADDTITAASIATGAFTADAFAADAIVAATLATGCLTADAFAADAIVAATLATGCITADAFAANAIIAATLAADCITEAKIADNAFANEHFAAGALTSAEITSAAGCAVTSIANDVITAAAIANGAIDAATFAAGAIDATAIAANAIDAATFAADVDAEIAAMIWNALTASYGGVGTYGQAVEDILVDTAEIGAAGAGLTNINLPNQTMDITGNITGNLSGSVGSVTGAVGSVAAGGITATSIATGAIDADALAADAIDEILDEAIEGAITLRQAMRVLMAYLAGKCSGGGTATVTFRNQADDDDRIVMTVDADGNRSAVVLDLA